MIDHKPLDKPHRGRAAPAHSNECRLLPLAGDRFQKFIADAGSGAELLKGCGS